MDTIHVLADDINHRIGGYNISASIYQCDNGIRYCALNDMLYPNEQIKIGLFRPDKGITLNIDECVDYVNTIPHRFEVIAHTYNVGYMWCRYIDVDCLFYNGDIHSCFDYGEIYSCFEYVNNDINYWHNPYKLLYYLGLQLGSYMCSNQATF